MAASHTNIYASICPDLNQGGGGCFRCARPLPAGRRKWCSDECLDWWHANHRYMVARAAALRRAEVFAIPRCRDDHGRYKTRRLHKHSLGYACARCAGIFPAARRRSGRRAATVEVNHIVPALGRHGALSCVHHQENLEVLCAPCHRAITAAQGRARTTGLAIDD